MSTIEEGCWHECCMRIFGWKTGCKYGVVFRYDFGTVVLELIDSVGVWERDLANLKVLGWNGMVRLNFVVH